MNNEKQSEIQQYFQSAIDDCKAKIACLTADCRADEAIFEKIRMNVFDIFRTVYTAGGKASGGSFEKQLDFLRRRLEEIPSSWQAALEAARSHGNSEKAHIEQLKLDTVAEIRQKAAQWSEEA